MGHYIFCHVMSPEMAGHKYHHCWHPPPPKSKIHFVTHHLFPFPIARHGSPEGGAGSGKGLESPPPPPAQGNFPPPKFWHRGPGGPIVVVHGNAYVCHGLAWWAG